MNLRAASHIFAQHGSQYSGGSSGCGCNGKCDGNCKDGYGSVGDQPTNAYPGLGLVILKHPAYAQYFNDVLAAVAKQRAVLDEIILVLNGEMLVQVPTEWKNLRVIRGSWPSPQHARNAGLLAASADWLCYLDGDNLPTADYFGRVRAAVLRADSTTAVLNPAPCCE